MFHCRNLTLVESKVIWPRKIALKEKNDHVHHAYYIISPALPSKVVGIFAHILLVSKYTLLRKWFPMFAILVPIFFTDSIIYQTYLPGIAISTNEDVVWLDVEVKLAKVVELLDGLDELKTQLSGTCWSAMSFISLESTIQL